MNSLDGLAVMNNGSRTIDDLPDEVLEFILGLLPPYKDLQDCMCVCKRWFNCTKNVMRKTAHDLNRAVSEFNIQWRNITPVDMAPSITKRFSHAACVHKNSMYIFGGCTTNSTAFNDLWRFDLSRRQWIRPLTMGTYPTPKAYATMICYEDSLILFGGWTYPSPSQHLQDSTMFNEIHFYNIITNRWKVMSTTNNPPPMAGHSAMIRDDTMIVFGGLYKPTIHSQIQCSNEVWILDLKTMVWAKQATATPRPHPRYGQSLITLNKNNLMILGGVQALQNKCVYNDCWVLKMEGSVWTWLELTIKNKEWSASNIWCNPAIKVGDKVVSLSRNQNGGRHPVTSAVRMATAERATVNSLSQRVGLSVRRPLDRDQNVNGRRGDLPHRRSDNDRNAQCEVNDNEVKPGPSNNNVDANRLFNRLKENNDNCPGPSTSNGAANLKVESKNEVLVQNKLQENINTQNKPFASRNIRGNKLLPNGAKIRHNRDNFRMAAFACDSPSPLPTPLDNDLMNQRKIAHLELMQVREPVERTPPATPVVKKMRRNTLSIHVLDISSVINDNCYSSVAWMCPREGEVSGAPEEFIMYSLVKGKGELIMFGGVHNDVNLINNYTSSPQYSNSLHFITPPRGII